MAANFATKSCEAEIASTKPAKPAVKCNADVPDPLPEGWWMQFREDMKSGGAIRAYAVPKVKASPVMNGKVEGEETWAHAPWSEDYTDVNGNHAASPRFQTRSKMMWDDEGLWIGAQLFEPQLYAVSTEKNSTLWAFDNNFELFIDPDYSYHNYYEFQMNVVNTVIELYLEKPRGDGGLGKIGTNLDGLRSAVHIEYADPVSAPKEPHSVTSKHTPTKFWSSTIHIPFAPLAKLLGRDSACPNVGDVWKFTMCRVEWETDIGPDGICRRTPGKEENDQIWTWSPHGRRDMHSPERWGILKFIDSENPGPQDPLKVDPLLPQKDYLCDFYYRNKDFFYKNKKYCMDEETLKLVAPAGWKFTAKSDADGSYKAVLKSDSTDVQVSITSERFIAVL